MKLYELKVKDLETTTELVCFTKKSAEKVVDDLNAIESPHHFVKWEYKEIKGKLTLLGWAMFLFGYRDAVTRFCFKEVR